VSHCRELGPPVCRRDQLGKKESRNNPPPTQSQPPSRGGRKRRKDESHEKRGASFFNISAEKSRFLRDRKEGDIVEKSNAVKQTTVTKRNLPGRGDAQPTLSRAKKRTTRFGSRKAQSVVGRKKFECRQVIQSLPLGGGSRPPHETQRRNASDSLEKNVSRREPSME